MTREVLDSFERFKARTVESVSDNGENVLIKFVDGTAARFYHDQDCCEFVRLENTVGDLQSLVGKTIASISEDDSEPEDQSGRNYEDSHTWSIFTIKTTDGAVVIMQWLGESNGYYGESVYVSFE